MDDPFPTTKPSGQLPRGTYWVGDLFYVVEDFFEQGWTSMRE
jgi:hypothetical protein